MYTVEFRELLSVDSRGNVAGRRIQYRRRTLTLNTSGLSISDWGPWEDFNVNVVTETV